MRRRIGLLLLGLGVMGWTLVPATAWLITRRFSERVIVISPHAKEIVELNRLTWAPGQPVPDLYGIPANEPVEFVFLDPSRLIIPSEAPKLKLLPVDKAAGENPLQARTIWFFTRFIIFGSALFIGAGAWLVRKPTAPTAAPRA